MITHAVVIVDNLLKIREGGVFGWRTLTKLRLRRVSETSVHGYEIFGREAELPNMLYFECPYAVLEKRILGRAPFSGRSDDNVESTKLRFDTFKAETLPTVEHFRSKGKCIEIDTSQDRQAVYDLVVSNLAEYTDSTFAAQPLTERAEILLGLRPYPKKE